MHLELLEDRRVLAALVDFDLETLGTSPPLTSSASHENEFVALEPPQFTSFPVDVFVLATSPDGAIVDFHLPTAEDDVDPNPVVQCTPSPGTQFPVGTTDVICTASDSDGNSISHR